MKTLSGKTRQDTADGVLFASAAYTEYSAELHRYLARRIARPQDAEDLAQEVFLRMLRVERPERVNKPVAYLFSVASHLIREFKLRTAREGEHVAYSSETVEEVGETHPSGPADDLMQRLNLQ